MMDGVPSKVNVLLWKVSNPESMFFLWKVSNPVLISLLFFLWIVSNPGHGTKITRGLDGYTDISYCSLGLLLNSSVWCHKSYPGHGTKIARGLVRYRG